MKTSTPQESFDFMWKFMASGAPSDPVMQRMGLIHMNNLRPLLAMDHDDLALSAMEEELAKFNRLVNDRDIKLITLKKELTAAKARATRLQKKLAAFE